MKILIVTLGICACIALAASEPCHGHDVSSCNLELCGNLTVACLHNTCTCIVDFCGVHNPSCHVTPGHCEHQASVHNCQCAHDWHCIDGHCSCGYPSSGTIVV